MLMGRFGLVDWGRNFGTSTIYSRIGLRVSWDFWFQAGCPKSQLWALRTWWNHVRKVLELPDETNVKFWNLNYIAFARYLTYLNEEIQSFKVNIDKSFHIITFGRKFLIHFSSFWIIGILLKVLVTFFFHPQQCLFSVFEKNRIEFSVFWNQIFEWATRTRITFL